MTPDERVLLTRFLGDLGAARGMAKDQEADAMIRQALSANPDAAYLLVQHAIVADQSLQAAQARIAELEDQLRNAPSAPSAASFLPPGTASGPWGPRRGAGYSPLPQDYEPAPPQQRPGLFSADSGLGSFLRNAGTTAAGVAGGEMLFNGLSDLFGRHQGGGLFGGEQGFVDRPGQIIVNNYDDNRDDYDDRDDDGQGSW